MTGPVKYMGVRTSGANPMKLITPTPKYSFIGLAPGWGLGQSC